MSCFTLAMFFGRAALFSGELYTVRSSRWISTARRCCGAAADIGMAIASKRSARFAMLLLISLTSARKSNRQINIKGVEIPEGRRPQTHQALAARLLNYALQS